MIINDHVPGEKKMVCLSDRIYCCLISPIYKWEWWYVLVWAVLHINDLCIKLKLSNFNVHPKFGFQTLSFITCYEWPGVISTIYILILDLFQIYLGIQLFLFLIPEHYCAEPNTHLDIRYWWQRLLTVGVLKVQSVIESGDFSDIPKNETYAAFYLKGWSGIEDEHAGVDIWMCVCVNFDRQPSSIPSFLTIGP